MRYKDILLHCGPVPGADSRLAVALDLARRHDAHLTAVFVHDIPDSVFFGDAGFGSATAMLDVMEKVRADLAAAEGAQRAAFDDALRANGLRGDWRSAEGRTGQLLALHARYADVLVTAQPGGKGTGEGVGDDAVVAPMLSAGRPVIAVPHSGKFEAVGRTVLLAWNASRESARAANDALPILAGAEKVRVLAIDPKDGVGGHGDVPGADIALHLARHGVAAEASHTISTGIGHGETLLSNAADIGADLIVAGGYSHSRARETVFGGVTRTLLRSMTVPVFLSH